MKVTGRAWAIDGNFRWSCRYTGCGRDVELPMALRTFPTDAFHGFGSRCFTKRGNHRSCILGRPCNRPYRHTTSGGSQTGAKPKRRSAFGVLQFSPDDRFGSAISNCQFHSIASRRDFSVAFQIANHARSVPDIPPAAYETFATLDELKREWEWELD